MERETFSELLMTVGHVSGAKAIEKFLNGEWDEMSLTNRIYLLVIGLQQMKKPGCDLSDCEKAYEVCDKLYTLLCSSDDVRNDVRIVTIVAEALVACGSLNKSAAQKIVDWIKLSIDVYGTGNESADCETCTLDMKTSLRLLSVALDCKDCDVIDDARCIGLFRCVIEFVVNGKHLLSDRLKALHVVPQFVSTRSTQITSFVEIIWKSIETSDVDMLFYLLCFLADMLLQSHSSMSTVVLQSNTFWLLVCRGLASGVSLERKQALYVLQRIIACYRSGTKLLGDSTYCDVFWWDEKEKSLLQTVWQEFFLVYEILQQKQVHIVKPALPRIHKLVLYTGLMAPKVGRPVLDMCWLGVIMTCMFKHDSITIVKLCVLECLHIDLTKCPLLFGKGLEMLCGPLLDILCDHSVYTRPLDEMLPGTLPPVAECVVSFFQRCESVLGDKMEDFLPRLVSAIATKDIRTATSLVFLFHALDQISSHPCWTDNVLTDLRLIAVKLLEVAQLIQRSAAQCMLLRVTMKHTKPGVSWRSVALLLAAVERDVSLTRDNAIWRELCVWIPTVVLFSPNDNSLHVGVLEDVKQEVHQCVLEDVKPEVSTLMRLDTKCLARFVVLIADTEKINPELVFSLKGKSLSVLVATLRPMCETLEGINSRAYLSHEQARVALALLVAVADELLPAGRIPMSGSGDATLLEFSRNVLACCEEIVGFVQRMLFSVTKMSDTSSSSLYHSVLQILWLSSSLECTNISRTAVTHLNSFTAACITTLQQDDQEHKFITPKKAVCLPALSIFIRTVLTLTAGNHHQCNYLISPPSVLALVLEYVSNFDLSMVFEKPLIQADCNTDVSSGGSYRWGCALADHVSALWTCLEACFVLSAVNDTRGLSDQFVDRVLSGSKLTLENYVGILDTSLAALECVKGPAVVVVMNVIEALIPKVWHDNSLQCVQALLAARNATIENWRDHMTFWPILDAYVKLAFQPFLLFQQAELSIHETLRELSFELVSLGESRLGVFNIFVAYCYQCWSQGLTRQDSQTVIDSIVTHLDLMQEGCLFGPLHKRGLKSIRYDTDMRSFLQTLGNNFPTNQLVDRSDAFVRVHCITLLLKLLVTHRQTENIIWKVIEFLIQKDEEISCSKPLYHGNTFEHRMKHRLWEVVLLLQSGCSDECRVVWLAECAFESLVFDNQPSVRVMIECLIVRLLLQHSDRLIDLLWSHLEKDHERRIGLLASLMNIVTLTGCHLPSCQQKVTFFSRALSSVLPWTQTHHFSVRVHAQAALHKMWSHCEEHHIDEILEQHSIVANCVRFGGLSSDAAKHRQRLLDNFIYSGLHPMEDFSVEFLFHTLPRLSGITGEEWISPCTFLKVDNVFWTSQASLLVMLPEHSRLHDCKPGLWVSADKKQTITENMPNKKIMPGELLSNVASANKSVRHVVGEEIHHDTIVNGEECSLVLVASLIDKAPNLGGLCRTCEVFAVKTLVLGNTKILDDRMFQSLSVTAEKWLDILEVRPVDLQAYLQSMRRRGYSLIGIEQTANSKCLTEYNFPRRSLLLLGNEREGIPAEYLALLDECVEIPQLGIIRSLNVHVSGALLVWEYTQQWRKLGGGCEQNESTHQ
ncbi:probable methyltransferase TARBP1 isoform X2 [Corticium candelabrum]|uniref:probable methyltransferase TARBP1 isoform X2 n=1 Tax=Corticium candelabrum TaxID=121492 RepID=UPI002E273DD2|nr:probable methyltransferase TARBP1 isoform X2 [Corticium candelabrum]